MRQLVSALELRFQSIESNTDLSTSTETSDLDGRYSQIGHTHSESEITDLQDYLVNLNSESIFDLEDVDGAPPDLNDTLVWDGDSFVPGGAGSVSIELDDLTDVNVPVVEDGDIILFNDSSQLWEAGALTLDSLSDIDLTGGEQYDLLYNSDGTIWKDTDSLKWNPDGNYLQLAFNHAINWLDSTPTFPVTRELLTFTNDTTTGRIAEHFSLELNQNFNTVSTSYVNVTDAVIAGSNFTVGDVKFKGMLMEISLKYSG